MGRRRPRAHDLSGPASSTRITQYEQSVLNAHFERLLDRREAACHLDLPSVTDLYDSSITEACRKALATLRESFEWAAAVNSGSQAHIFLMCDANVNDGCVTEMELGRLTGLARTIHVRKHLGLTSLLVGFPTSVLLPRISFKDALLLTPSNPFYARIDSYLAERALVRRQNREAASAIRVLYGHCSTHGQAMRIWPEVAMFIPHEDKRKMVLAQKVKSPLPRDISESELEVLQAQLQEAAAYCTQAMLLPDKRPGWNVN